MLWGLWRGLKRFGGAKWCQNVMFRWVYVVPSTK
nr:MAG TPA: hypothetical protein [Caudoviricetes sp.]